MTVWHNDFSISFKYHWMFPFQSTKIFLPIFLDTGA